VVAVVLVVMVAQVERVLLLIMKMVVMDLLVAVEVVQHLAIHLLILELAVVEALEFLVKEQMDLVARLVAGLKEAVVGVVDHLEVVAIQVELYLELVVQVESMAVAVVAGFPMKVEMLRVVAL
jgi:hypothetical protein